MPKFVRGASLPAAERERLFDNNNKMIRALTCAVAYPDGREGICNYTREGPASYLFEYFIGGREFAWVRITHPIPNTHAAIVERVNAETETAFEKAREAELKWRFRRATPDTGGVFVKNPKLYRLDEKAAKAMAGHYALCAVKADGDLIPVAPVREEIGDANNDWRNQPEEGKPKTVVGCCSRFNRRWEVPKLNALYKDAPFMRPTEEKS